MKLAIGIECVGASYSFAVLAKFSGEVILAERYPIPINASELPTNETGQRLFTLVKSTLARHQDSLSVKGFLKEGGRICAGIAGLQPGDDPVKEEIRRHAGLDKNSCVLTGDAEVLLPGATGALRGAVVLVGAGSVVYANGPAGAHRVGGWGPLLGDEGSGYYLGRKALHALTWYRDGYRKPCRELATAVKHCLDESPEEWGEAWRQIVAMHRPTGTCDHAWIDCLIPLIRWAIRRGLWRYAVSSLAPALISAAETEAHTHSSPKDRIAERIMRKSIDEHLRKRLDSAVDRAGLNGKSFPVVLAGGVFAHRQYFREEFARAVEAGRGTRYRSVNWHFNAPQGIYHTGAGALLYALSDREGEVPNQDMCYRINKTALDLLTAKHGGSPARPLRGCEQEQ